VCVCVLGGGGVEVEAVGASRSPRLAGESIKQRQIELVATTVCGCRVKG
jgi:hypothetical protein